MRVNTIPVQVPKWMAEFPQITTVAVAGGCLAGLPNPKGHQAHAHVDGTGVVCILEANRWDSAYPSPTFLHEVAHVEDSGEDHGPTWASRFAQLLETWDYQVSNGARWESPLWAIHYWAWTAKTFNGLADSQFRLKIG